MCRGKGHGHKYVRQYCFYQNLMVSKAGALAGLLQWSLGAADRGQRAPAKRAKSSKATGEERKFHYSHEVGFCSGEKKGILPGNCQPAPPLAVGDRKEPGSPPPSGGNRGAGAPVPVEILVPWPALKQEGGKARRVTGPTRKVFLAFWGLGFGFFLFLGKEPRGKLPCQHWSKGLPPSTKLP